MILSGFYYYQTTWQQPSDINTRIFKAAKIMLLFVVLRYKEEGGKVEMEAS